MRIDEVALDALLPPSAVPMVRTLDSDLSIEILFEDDDLADATATRQFNRFSSPYERIELSDIAPLPTRRSRPTTFVKTVATLAKGTPSTGVPSLRPTVRMPAMAAPRPTVPMIAPRPTVPMMAPRIEMPLAAPPSVTVPFERVWFDDEQPEKLAAIEEPVVEPKTSWWWLAISLVAGAAAVAWMASL